MTLPVSALILSLVISLACTACAFHTEGRSQTENKEIMESSVFGETDAPESNAESSVEPAPAESEGTESRPTESAPVVPIGTKTTLEKVAAYPIAGEDEGLFYTFGFTVQHSENAAGVVEQVYPLRIDANGDVYIEMYSKVLRLRDGKEWESEQEWGVAYTDGYAHYNTDFVVSDGYLYMAFDNGLVEQYDMEGNLVKLHTACADRKLPVSRADLYLDADGKPYLGDWDDDKYKYRRFRLDGTEILGGDMPFRIGEDGEEAQQVPEKSGYCIGVHGSSYVQEQLKSSEIDVNFNHSCEGIYSVYHEDGTLLSNFRYLEIRSAEKSPCSIPCSNCSVIVKNTYTATVIIDDTVFEDVLNSQVYAAEDAGLYLALYYQDRMDLYRITPGHTDGLKLGALSEYLAS